MMDSLISWKQTGAESFPPEYLLFWTATGSAGQDDPIKVLVLYEPSPADLSCTAQHVVFWALEFYFTVLIIQRNLIQGLFKLLVITAETNPLAE